MRRQVPYVTAVLIAANIIVFLLAELFSGSTESTRTLIAWGGAYVPLVAKGEWWRLFTSMFLHAGIRHLLNNMLVLFVMGEHLERLLGRVRYGVVYIAGGLISNYCAFRWYLSRDRQVVSIGASGAVFAVIGALIWIILRNRGRADGLTLRQILVMFALSLYFGFATAGVSNIAHISGAAAGFLLGLVLYRKKPVRTERSVPAGK